MTLRVIQWATGGVGRAAIQAVGDHPELELVGCWVHSPEEGWVRNPGVVATANHCVNSIPYVVRAGPGIKTYLDLPVIAGRAHPRFARRT